MRGFTHYTTKAACDLWVGPASSVNKAAEGWLEPRSSANLDKLCNITDKHTRDVGLFTSDFRYKRGELESFRKASIKESSRTTKTRAGITCEQQDGRLSPFWAESFLSQHQQRHVRMIGNGNSLGSPFALCQVTLCSLEFHLNTNLNISVSVSLLFGAGHDRG